MGTCARIGPQERAVWSGAASAATEAGEEVSARGSNTERALMRRHEPKQSRQRKVRLLAPRPSAVGHSAYARNEEPKGARPCAHGGKDAVYLIWSRPTLRPDFNLATRTERSSCVAQEVCRPLSKIQSRPVNVEPVFENIVVPVAKFKSRGQVQVAWPSSSRIAKFKRCLPSRCMPQRACVAPSRVCVVLASVMA
eukprot:6190218-Pleurochrysis_carterae.AAC.1